MFLQLFIFADVPAVNNLNMKKILFAMFCALSMVCFFSCGLEDSVTYELKPREELPVKEDGSCTKIFLAGTIDMGNSVDWQAQLKEYFSGKEGRYILYNPRRGSWNGGAGGEMEYQVNWELEHLEKADIIIMNILGSSKSPITLLEMGLHARSGKLYVACEPSFYRYDNVRITCAYYGIPLYPSLDALLESLGL